VRYILISALFIFAASARADDAPKQTATPAAKASKSPEEKIERFTKAIKTKPTAAQSRQKFGRAG